jgi:recombinational DNA repair protein (RecF pathway)
MYHKHHTKGIVISGQIQGDNRFINIFTENFGLIFAKVQGATSTHSKLRAGVQDFSFGEFSLISGKTGWKVVGATPQKNLFEIFRSDKNKLKIVCNILNLIKKLISEEVRNTNHSVFAVVSNFFIFLENSKGVFEMSRSQKTPFDEVALAECLVLLRILHTLGFLRHDPELSLPVNSSEIISDHLNQIAPRRSHIISLINESLKSI